MGWIVVFWGIFCTCMDRCSDGIAVVAKVPELGGVKTRIGAVWGAEAALRIYRVLFDYTLGCVAQVPVRKYLYVNRVVPYQFPEMFRLYIQCDGDIGSRMRGVFEDLLECGLRKVVVVGSDCPYLECRHIEEAFGMLESCDVVLGPTKDGGYYLIGMKALHGCLFENKAWSTASVLEDTLRDVAGLGLRAGLLEWLEDVDTVEDWLSCPFCVGHGV
jgi:rSAM/selenodomain-associated transferase 1